MKRWTGRQTSSLALCPALAPSVSGSLQEIALPAVRPERGNFQQGLPSKAASTVIAESRLVDTARNLQQTLYRPFGGGLASMHNPQR
jgi:hypothetical protein